MVAFLHLEGAIGPFLLLVRQEAATLPFPANLQFSSKAE
jgi:hypothetical protein